MENEYGFIIYEYLPTDDFTITDIFRKKHSISNGDRLYAIGGKMYYHDKSGDKLIMLKFSFKKFFDNDTYLSFDQL